MAGYVEYIFSYLTQQVHQETVTFAPSERAPWQPSQWKITHDAAGKVVVRAMDHKQRLQVIATAAWTGTASTDRMHANPAFPTAAQWEAIDQALRDILAHQGSYPLNPALDPGTLANPKPAEDARTGSHQKLGVLGWIGAGIVLVLIVIGVTVGGRILERLGFTATGSRANGEECSADSDCRSGDCHKWRCRGDRNTKVRGDRCEEAWECKSNTCRRGICD